MIRATLWDFGGVLLSSPFEAFARYELDRGLPSGFLRGLNATNPDTNAWARLERSEVPFEEFCALYEEEARVAGREIDAREVIPLLAGELRPAMVEALQRCKERLKTACLTNNFAPAGSPGRAGASGGRTPRGEVFELFDVVVESSQIGVRKPDPEFYVRACRLLDIEPHEAVFLDDLGVNLKPARAMGMTTIKVVDPDQAIDALETVVGFPLRSPATWSGHKADRGTG